MDTFCWIESTFSIPSRWVGKLGHHMPHPGIAPLTDLEKEVYVCYFKSVVLNNLKMLTYFSVQN